MFHFIMSIYKIIYRLSIQREMAKTADNKLRHQLQYSKSASRYVVKKVMAPKDYSFRREILQGIVARCMGGPKLRRVLQGVTSTKETTLAEHAGIKKPIKEEAVAQQRTRFTDK